MWIQGVARRAPSPPEGKPLSVTLSKVISISEHVTSAAITLNRGPYQRGSHLNKLTCIQYNMTETGERENVLERKLLAQHCVHTSSRPWPPVVVWCIFVSIFCESACVPATCPAMCSACVHACVSPRVSDVLLQSHPLGVRYLIAWIDQPKESVTFTSFYHAASSPNKAVEPLV